MGAMITDELTAPWRRSTVLYYLYCSSSVRFSSTLNNAVPSGSIRFQLRHFGRDHSMTLLRVIESVVNRGIFSSALVQVSVTMWKSSSPSADTSVVFFRIPRASSPASNSRRLGVPRCFRPDGPCCKRPIWPPARRPAGSLPRSAAALAAHGTVCPSWRGP